MATSQSHFSLSLIVAAVYSIAALLLFHFKPELVLLAAVLVVVAGMLPNIDQGGSNQAKETASLLAAVAPLFCLEFFPSIAQGGIARIALVVVLCYLLTRLLVVRSLKKYTTHRGMVHSIPAAIIAAEVTYLMFWDLQREGKIFLALAAFSGFMTHLVLDAYGNLDLMKSATGQKEKKPAVLKVLGDTGKGNFVAYATMLVLGWFVAKDIYPALGFYAKVTY
jgi:membrane-bound metal-dependent hydrolase YbcI (DUF457 family)